MELFKQAMRIKPAVAYYSLGNALFRTGRASEAIEQYKEALRIDPDYAEAHNNLGSTLFQTGRTSEAIEEYKQVCGSVLILLTRITISELLWSKWAELRKR